MIYLYADTINLQIFFFQLIFQRQFIGDVKYVHDRCTRVYTMREVSPCVNGQVLFFAAHLDGYEVEKKG